MPEQKQKTSEQWQKEYDNGDHTVRSLYDWGFRCRSNKYQIAVKEYNYWGKHYHITIDLCTGDYADLKDLPHQIELEEADAEDRAAYDQIQRLVDKFGPFTNKKGDNYE